MSVIDLIKTKCKEVVCRSGGGRWRKEDRFRIWKQRKQEQRPLGSTPLKSRRSTLSGFMQWIHPYCSRFRKAVVHKRRLGRLHKRHKVCFDCFGLAWKHIYESTLARDFHISEPFSPDDYRASSTSHYNMGVYTCISLDVLTVFGVCMHVPWQFCVKIAVGMSTTGLNPFIFSGNGIIVSRSPEIHHDVSTVCFRSAARKGKKPFACISSCIPQVYITSYATSTCSSVDSRPSIDC